MLTILLAGVCWEATGSDKAEQEQFSKIDITGVKLLKDKLNLPKV